jgi:hypothetical protein
MFVIEFSYAFSFDVVREREEKLEIKLEKECFMKFKNKLDSPQSLFEFRIVATFPLFSVFITRCRIKHKLT